MVFETLHREPLYIIVIHIHKSIYVLRHLKDIFLEKKKYDNKSFKMGQKKMGQKILQQSNKKKIKNLGDLFGRI